MTIEGFNKTGIPSSLWEFMEPFAQINHASGIAVLAVVILILSNMVSNVSTGMFIMHNDIWQFGIDQNSADQWNFIHNALRYPFMGHCYSYD